MTPRPEIPVFGVRVQGCSYVVRPSAYAIVLNEFGRVAVVRAPEGCFLPGGGIENGETAEQTVEREAREECGLILAAGSVLDCAVDIVHSVRENTCFEKRSAFLQADLIAIAVPQEPGHELIWLAHYVAMATLSHEGHRWAVARRDYPARGPKR
jgi:8-oxo-dGTP diphosphatase